jgi:hypothetical protein
MIAGTYNMTIDQGSTFRIVVGIQDSAYQPMNLEGASARMQVRSSSTSGGLMLQATSDDGEIVVDGVDGTLTIQISHEKTKLLVPSVAVYDLEVYMADGTVWKVLKGRCRIQGEVTR